MRFDSVAIRRAFGISACLGAISVALAGTTVAGESRPPNFIVMMADDLGAKELGCYGNAEHQTPHLDRLAQQGMRFRTCYATPLCSPTRVMLMTGRYGFRTGWVNLIGRPGAPPPESPLHDLGTAQITFADVLKTRGYATALAGKWQLSGSGSTLVHDCGFDEYMIWAYKHNLPPGVVHTGGWENERTQKTSRYWHPSIMRNGEYVPTEANDYGPSMFTDFIIDFIRRHRDEPFLVYYPMCLIHKPWETTPVAGHPDERGPGGLKANVEAMDDLVGRIVAAIDDTNLASNTYILFTGDNGTGGDGKGTVTELGARVPLIVRGPDVSADTVSDELVDLTDVLPTLAELAGADVPTDRTIDGRSLAPTLYGEEGTHREWIFAYLTDRRVLRDKRFLLEGNGRFYDCGDHRDHEGYVDVTDSMDPEVLVARERFEKILANLPAPQIEGLPRAKGGRRAKAE